MTEENTTALCSPNVVFHLNQPVELCHYDFLTMFLENRKHSFGTIVSHSLVNSQAIMITYESADTVQYVIRKRFFKFKKYLLRAIPLADGFKINKDSFSTLSFRMVPMNQIFSLNENQLVVRNLQTDDESDIQLYAEYLVDGSVEVVKIVKSKLEPHLAYLTFSERPDNEIIKRKYQKRPKVCGKPVSLLDSYICNSVIIFNPYDAQVGLNNSSVVFKILSLTIRQLSIDKDFVYDWTVNQNRLFVLVEFSSSAGLDETLPLLQQSVNKVSEEVGCPLAIEHLHNYQLFDWINDAQDSKQENDSNEIRSKQSDSSDMSSASSESVANSGDQLVSSSQPSPESQSSDQNNNEKSPSESSSSSTDQAKSGTQGQKILGRIVLADETVINQVYLHCNEIRLALKELLASKDKNLNLRVMCEPETKKRKSIVIERLYESELDFKWELNVYSWLEEFNKSYLDYKTIILPKINRVLNGSTISTVNIASVISNLKAMTERAKQEHKMVNYLEFYEDATSYCIKCHGLKSSLEQNMNILRKEIERLKVEEAKKPLSLPVQVASSHAIDASSSTQHVNDQVDLPNKETKLEPSIETPQAPINTQTTTIDLHPNRLLGLVLSKCPRTFSYVEEFLKANNSDKLSLKLDKSSEKISIRASVTESQVASSMSQGNLKASLLESVKQFESVKLVNKTTQIPSGATIADKLSLRLNAINSTTNDRCFFEIGSDKSTVHCYGIKDTMTEEAMAAVNKLIQRLEEEQKSIIMDKKIKILSSGTAVQAVIRNKSDVPVETQKLLIDVKSGLHFSLNEWNWVKEELNKLVSQYGASVNSKCFDSGRKVFFIEYINCQDEIKKIVDDYVSKYDKKVVNLTKMLKVDDTWIEKEFKNTIERSISPKSFDLRYWLRREGQTNHLILDAFGSKTRISSLGKLIEQTFSQRNKRKSSESDSSSSSNNRNNMLSNISITISNIPPSSGDGGANAKNARLA